LRAQSLGARKRIGWCLIDDFDRLGARRSLGGLPDRRAAFSKKALTEYDLPAHRPQFAGLFAAVTVILGALAEGIH
jgi:hypothetical protein